MKHLLLTTIAAVMLMGTAFAGPIHDAARKGDIEAVKQHLAAGRNVNAKDDKGRIPLHRAAREGHTEVAELLIANGAYVNAKDKEGKTPLYHAARWGHKNTTALLIAAGADVNAKDDKGRTPLDRAVGNTEIIALLRNHGGRTAQELKALIDAAEEGNIEAVKQHLAAGMDVNAKDEDGVTPLHEAALWGHNEVANLLRKHGGKTTPEGYSDTIADDRTSAERRRTEKIGEVGRIGVGAAIERLKEQALKRAQKGLLP